MRFDDGKVGYACVIEVIGRTALAIVHALHVFADGNFRSIDVERRHRDPVDRALVRFAIYPPSLEGAAGNERHSKWNAPNVLDAEPVGT
jgi:hypothetical protein